MLTKKTTIYKIDEKTIDEKNAKSGGGIDVKLPDNSIIQQINSIGNIIKQCADIIKSGGVVVFPTETVYGVGADAFNDKAVKDIYFAKKRPPKKPLLCHCGSIRQAEQIAYLNDDARRLIEAFTPGPLSVIVKKKSSISDTVTSNGDTVGLRFPSNKIFLRLSEYAGCPIAATSANISGNISAKNGDEVIKELFGRVDAIIDAGDTEYGLESTIVSLVGKAKIIRQGAVGRKEIEEVISLCD